MLNYRFLPTFILLTITFRVNQAYSEHKHSLTFRVRRYVVVCTDCKSAQQCTTIEGTPMPFPKLHPGPCSSVGMPRGRGRQTHRQTDRHTHRRRWPPYISRRLQLTRNDNLYFTDIRQQKKRENVINTITPIYGWEVELLECQSGSVRIFLFTDSSGLQTSAHQ